MADTTNADANGDDDDKRTQVAKHSYLTADGSVTKDIHEATGIKYEDVESKETFEFQIPGAAAGSPQTMLAVFGAKTKATNEASQIRQQLRKGEEPECSQVDAVLDAFAKIESGVWREPGEGRVGVKVDRDALAAAIAEAKSAAGLEADVAAIRQRLDDDVAYFRKARKVPEVSAIYDAKVGKEPAKPLTAADL